MEKLKVVISIVFSLIFLAMITGSMSDNNLVTENGVMQLLLALILFGMVFTFIFLIIDTIFEKAQTLKNKNLENSMGGESTYFYQTDEQLFEEYLDLKLEEKEISPEFYKELLKRKILLK